MWRLIAVVLVACGSAPPPPPIANRSTPEIERVAPVSACPQWFISNTASWKHIAFPQCAPEPFTHEHGCGEACPRPCRVSGPPAVIPLSAVSYDARGRWVRTAPVNDEMAAVTEAVYDGDRLVAVTFASGYADGKTTFSYDARGRLTGIDDHTRLEYDRDGRVVRYVASGEIVELAYDGAGRLVRQIDRQREIVHTYHYDGEGYLVRADDDGGVGGRAVATYHYDAQRRLVRWAKVWPPESPGLKAAEDEFSYDPQGRLVRVASRVTTEDGTDEPLVTRYEYDCR
jgi:YD repeat-containing protein